MGEFVFLLCIFWSGFFPPVRKGGLSLFHVCERCLGGPVRGLGGVVGRFPGINRIGRVGTLASNLVGRACLMGSMSPRRPSCMLRQVGRLVFAGVRVLRRGVRMIAERVHRGLRTERRRSVRHGMLRFLPSAGNGACFCSKRNC